MAGSLPGFPSDAFRNGIRFAMDMGAPPIEGERATFYFEPQLVYNRPVDDDDVPFDPTSTVVRETPDPLQVTCAVEYFDAQGNPSSFGLIVPSRATILLLDEEYQQVKLAIGVLLRGEKFIYKSTEMPLGLFDVGIYQMHFISEDAV